ncbi:MAG: hypothetical protein WCK11_05420 [Candidatus Falkowbacteria bacterium]
MTQKTKQAKVKFTSTGQLVIFIITAIAILTASLSWFNWNMIMLGKTISQGRNATSTINLVAMNQNYRNGVRGILNRYDLAQANLAVAHVSQLRRELLDMVLPARYKNIHTNFVFAFDRLELALQNGDQAKIAAAKHEIDILRQDQSWLN